MFQTTQPAKNTLSKNPTRHMSPLCKEAYCYVSVNIKHIATQVRMMA